MSPQDLKSVLQAGLLSFPLTDFDENLRFAPKPYADRLEWLQPYGASALFAAGGTGEFFSLEPREYSEVIKVALDTCKNRTPILAGAGGGTTLAIQYAQEAERLGAQGILLLPHYLTEASQEGLIAHVQAVCRSVKFGVVVYNRGDCRLTPASLQVLADFPGWEAWVNYPNDQQRLFRLIRDTGARGVVMLSGDTHYGEITRQAENVPYPLYDITSSGLTQVWHVPVPNALRIDGRYFRQANFGMVEIDWARRHLALVLRDERGGELMRQSLALADLAPR